MSGENLFKYLKKSSKRIKTRTTSLYGSIEVIEKDSLPDDFDLEYVFHFIEHAVPKFFSDSIEQIVIGSFPEFEERNITAAYSDGAIYVSEDQRDEKDMIDDIVHEISHAFESVSSDMIYGDGSIEREFLNKKKKLNSYLEYEGFKIPQNFFDVEYNKNVDDFLYYTVGYGILESLTRNLFLSPYSSTSLSEYWGIGFENFFLGSRRDVLDITPSIYRKLEEIVEGIDVYF